MSVFLCLFVCLYVSADSVSVKCQCLPMRLCLCLSSVYACPFIRLDMSASVIESVFSSISIFVYFSLLYDSKVTPSQQVLSLPSFCNLSEHVLQLVFARDLDIDEIAKFNAAIRWGKNFCAKQEGKYVCFLLKGKIFFATEHIIKSSRYH